LTLIGLKDEMELEVWAETNGRWVHIVTYDVLAASGWRGPKQRAGDLQVPEGIYRITELNPNSRFHLSMKLDYPNSYDRMKAREDGRSHLGGDIYIHGKAKSKGCLALADAAIEELFVLAAKTGIENTKVLIVPYDFRQKTPRMDPENSPAWLPELYEQLGQELVKYTTRGTLWPRNALIN
jgi:murein L,D-transpeptidase YafK